MYTLHQWKEARRLLGLAHGHHIKVLGFRPRIRGKPDPKVKEFDQPIALYNTQPANAHDRCGALGEIVHIYGEYANRDRSVDEAYDQVVAELGLEVDKDLSRLGVTEKVDSNWFWSTGMGDSPLPHRDVTLNLYVLRQGGVTGRQIDATHHCSTEHLRLARQVFGRLNIDLRIGTPLTELNGIVQSGSAESLLGPPGTDTSYPAGAFDEQGWNKHLLGQYFTGLTSATNAGNAVNVVYVPEFRDRADTGTQGYTMRIRGHGLSGSQTTMKIPAVIVRESAVDGGENTYPTTLAHELGHAITNCGEHSNIGQNLMAGGAARDGSNRVHFGQTLLMHLNLRRSLGRRA